MFSWLKKLVEPTTYQYRYNFKCRRFPWGYSFQFKALHDVGQDKLMPSSVTQRYCLVCMENDSVKYRQFYGGSNENTLSSIYGTYGAVDETYGKALEAFLAALYPYCSRHEGGTITFTTNEEISNDVQGIERFNRLLIEAIDFKLVQAGNFIFLGKILEKINDIYQHTHQSGDESCRSDEGTTHGVNG